ncbi:unnamed protein product [Phyllotreta striolata]|uniref:Cytochrome P450 n=1 Tax=Phyllotreta striolata TaxID=444603 RepID=A0A9N9XNY3_PHYSR|nr:unnamed protein product [Phyllotreta striolata]
MLLYVLVSVICAICIYIKWKQTYWKRNGVDYIEPDFFFGNTTAITKRKEHRAVVFQKFYNYFKGKGERFGGIYDFFSPVVVVTDLELIRCVLQKDFSHFVNHLGYINEEADPISGNLFNLKDEKWKNIRAKLTPTFTTGKIKMMFETLIDCSSGLQKVLDKYAIINEPVDIKKILLLFSTDVITSVAFGLQVNSLENPQTEFRRYFEKLFEPSLTLLIKRLISLSFPQWLLVKMRFRLSRKEVEEFFVKVVNDIVEHREKNNVFRKDFMQLLIQIKNSGTTTNIENINAHSAVKHLTINEMTAQAVTFYIAGNETSSATMSFALLELALNPSIQNKLREEIRANVKKHGNELTYDGIMEMEYLDLVVQEALRKYPSASGLSRACNKPYRIPGSDVVIEPGTEVMIPLYGLHRDPEYYPDPDKFDPERFNATNRSKIPVSAYLPFGEGPRACIGLRFGKLQTKVGICAVIWKFKVTVNNKTQLPIKLSSSRFPTAQGGIWLNLEKI